MSIYSISFLKNFIKSFFDTDRAHWVTAISVMEEFKKGMMEGYPMQNGLFEKFYDHAAIYMEYKKIGISKWNSDTVQKTTATWI